VHPETRFWLVRARVGLALGAVVAVLEYSHYAPLVTPPQALGAKALGLLLAEWGTEFLVLSLVVGGAERLARPGEPSPLRLAFAVLLGALVGVVGGYVGLDFLLRDVLATGLFVDHVGQTVEWAGRALYHGWMLLFFGGLAVSVEASQRRRVRMLRALRGAELARAAAQQRLAEASLGALRERIDPEYVFQTLSRLERLYESDPEAADRQLDELIAFLRKALADLQSAQAEPAAGTAASYFRAA